MKRSLFQIVVIFILLSLLYLIAYMWQETTLNFTILGVIGIVLGILIMIPAKYNYKINNNDDFDNSEVPLKRNSISIIASLFLIILSGLTLWTLHNYFYADKSVYSNNMHHALRLDGFTINNPNGLVLAKNENTALFDKKDFNGSVIIRDFNDSTVTLVTKGFTHPVYIDAGESRKKLLNKKNFILFKENDTLTFVKKSGVGVEEKIEFWFDEHNNSKKDSADYYFRYNGNTAVSQIKTLFKVGYDMNGLLAGVPFASFNFNGIDIVREKSHPRANNDEISDADGTYFVLNVNNTALNKNYRDISEIIYKGIRYDLAQADREDVIAVKMKKLNEADKFASSGCITIGYGETKSPPFRFLYKDGKIHIEFEMPYYKPLNNHKNSITEKVLVANSKMNYDIAERSIQDSLLVIEEDPSNLIVFDIFDNKDNKYLFKPFHLSYVVGDTREKMSFLCQKYDDTTDQSYSAVCSKKSIFRANDSLAISVAAKENSDITWKMCVENLRESTPFDSQKMMWIVLLIALAAVISINFHHLVDRGHQDACLNTFTYVEYIAYIVLIFFIAFRCFLLWRTSVFHPLENVTKFEMGTIFHNVGHYICMIVALGFLFAVIFIVKYRISRINLKSYTISYRLEKDELFVLGFPKLLYLSPILYTISVFVMYSGSLGGRIGLALTVIFYFLNDILINTQYYPTYKQEDIITDRQRLRAITPLFLTFLNMAITIAVLVKPDSGFMIMFATFCLITFCFKLIDLYTKVYQNNGHGIYFIAFTLFVLVVAVLIFYKKVIIDAFESVTFIMIFSLIIIGIFYALCTIMRIPILSLNKDNGVDQEEGRFGDNVMALLGVLFCLFLTAWGASSCCNDWWWCIAIFIIEISVPLFIIFTPQINLSLFKTYRYYCLAILFVCIMTIITIVLCADGVSLSDIFMNKLASIPLLIILLFINAFVFRKVSVPIILNENIKAGMFVLITWTILFIVFISGTMLFSKNISIVDILGREGSHTVQRINVLINEPDEALARISSNNDERRFLQASHNHWILNQYKQRSENIEIFGEKGNGYFKMQPQSKLGAMWNAQVTDIVVLRYVISEHSRILPVIFIVLLLMMVYYGLRKITYYRFTKSLLVQIPLLLFIQSALIWLANTGYFVFFGQDFPLLSITAKIMIVYSIVLILMWILAAIIESFMYRAYGEDDNYVGISNSNKGVAASALFLLIVFLLTIIGVQSYLEKDNEVTDYNMEKLFTEANESYIPFINGLFAEYQRVNGKINLKNNMHPDIVAFAKARFDTLNNRVLSNSDVETDSSYVTINDHIKLMFKRKAQESKGDTAAYNFPLRVWENFVKYGSYDNKYGNLMHVHNAKRDSLVIAMRTKYYDLKLPLNIKDEWRGDIVEQAAPLYEKDTVFTSKKDDVKFYILNKEWVAEGENRCIVKGGIDNAYSLDNVKVWHRDNTIKYNGKQVESSLMPKPTYWARSVLVNGKAQFIYPNGETSYWIRDLTQMIRKNKNDEIMQCKDIDKDSVINSDVEITLNGNLSNKLYKTLNNMAKEGQSKTKAYLKDVVAYSLIVADGNGNILTMVDAKPGYEVDPNDTKRINDINEMLYMNVDGERNVKESRFFENKNFVRMDGGPGSSQKPIVWTAIASAIPNIVWEHFTLEKVDKEYIETEDRAYVINKFNGKDIYKFRSLLSDENRGKSDIGLDKFLKHSSNYYSATMVYIGLHNKELYNNHNFTAQDNNKNKEARLFKKYSKLKGDKQEYRNNFPFLKFAGTKTTPIFIFDKKINYTEFDKSILYHQMSEKFGMETKLGERNRDAKLLYHNFKDPNAFIRPQVSTLNFDKLMNEEDADDKKANNAVRSIATGDKRAWEVTPLAMAEMYGKMVYLSSSFNLSFIPRESSDFNKVRDIHNNNTNFLNAEPKKYSGMNKCFFEEGGTASGEKRIYKKYGIGIDSCCVLYNNAEYYIYAKTGTTDETFYVKGNERSKVKKEGYEKAKVDLRRMAIIISNKKLDEDNSDAKVIIMYFTMDYYKSNFLTTVNESIAQVIKSDAFKAYMED